MKAQVLDLNGNKTKEIELPSCFNDKVRDDIIKRAFEAEISDDRTPYGNYEWAGKEYSAAGKIKHQRRKWKTAYGYGISRVPRKIFSRRGTRFVWAGAFAAGTVGGKEAHPPKPWKSWTKKVNKKEKVAAMRSAIAATANISSIIKRYRNIDNDLRINVPIIIESKISDIKKANDFKKTVEKIIKQISEQLMKIALREDKKVRAGKGKTRGRKYKKARGVLIVTAKEVMAAKGLSGIGIDVISVSKLNLKQLAPSGVPGRLTIYTEDAIKEMEKIERLK